MKELIPVERIEKCILLIRGQKVMLDSDLAKLYCVTTKRFNEQVKRNIKRFPADFMFQLTIEEAEILRSHFATSSETHGGRRYLPFVFTEHGIAMLSSVLKSERAIQVNIQIIRAFIELRKILGAHRDLAQKLQQLEKKYDAQFKSVFEAIWKLMEIKERPKRRIGFTVDEE